MEKLTIIAIFFATSTFAQIGASISYSLSMESSEEVGFSLEDRMGKCLNISYYLKEGKALSVQLKDRELWRYGPEPNSFALFKTVGGKFLLCGSAEEKTKWFFCHEVGVSVAIGKPAYEEDPNLHLLKIAYFSGISIQVGVGTKLYKKFLFVIFVRSEGVYGLLRDGNEGRQSGGANGFGMVGISIKGD
jgi:hypothetical protein